MIILGTPLSQEQWNKYKDPEERILNPQEVKEIIFHGVCIYIVQIYILIVFHK